MAGAAQPEDRPGCQSARVGRGGRDPRGDPHPPPQSRWRRTACSPAVATITTAASTSSSSPTRGRRHSATPRRRGRVGPAPASRHHRRGASQLRRSARPARRQRRTAARRVYALGRADRNRTSAALCSGECAVARDPQAIARDRAMTAVAGILVETDPPSADSAGRRPRGVVQDTAPHGPSQEPKVVPARPSGARQRPGTLYLRQRGRPWLCGRPAASRPRRSGLSAG